MCSKAESVCFNQVHTLDPADERVELCRPNNTDRAFAATWARARLTGLCCAGVKKNNNNKNNPRQRNNQTNKQTFAAGVVNQDFCLMPEENQIRERTNE